VVLETTMATINDKWVLVSEGNIWKIRRETVTEWILNSTN
jgi:hypothetical protein